MRLPSPASSCNSSDCEGDRVVHALKRMKIAHGSAGIGTVSLDFNPLRRKEPVSVRACPMLVSDDISKDRAMAEKKRKEQERRKLMQEILQQQMREYKSQYTNITEGMDIAPCHGGFN
jgi:hypothetical protein